MRKKFLLNFQQKNTNGFDEIADKIIDAFTIKTADRFIDSEEGIMSNENSEKHLIIMGSVLGIILNVTLSALLVLASVVFSDKFDLWKLTMAIIVIRKKTDWASN